MSHPEPVIRGIGWRGRWLRREPLILVAVLLVIVAFGVSNVFLHGDHSQTGANAIGGPVSVKGQAKH